MKAHLTRRYQISAAHRLHNGDFTDEQNRATYGKCNNPHGHGHTYIIEVTVGGQVDPQTGMVCDLVALDSIVNERVIVRYDHQNLNCLAEFANLVPTTEHLAIAIFNLLKQRIVSAQLEKVRIEETSKNSFEYSGESD